MAQILHGFGRNRRADFRRRQELHYRGRRLEDVMNTDNGLFGLIVGGIVAVAIAIFVFSGGDYGGKKTVEGDDDLPPIATADK
jgi:hypothetical protein